MTDHLRSLGHKRRGAAFTLSAVLLALVFIMVGTRTALAHTRVEIGPYAVVVGWQVEPPIVGERNALTVEVTREEQAVEGVEATLNVEVLYAGRSFRANLNPTATPGLYTAEILPTVRGQYEVRLFGTLGDLEVDEVVEPEEIFPADRIQFPEPLPDARALQQDVAALEAELQTARALATAGASAGALGLILAAFALLRRR